MAKPIKATPTLVGDEANIFVERMLSLEKSRITSSERRLFENVNALSREMIICA